MGAISTNAEKTKELSIVRLALASGYQPHERNATATKHFYFYGPVQLEIHWFMGYPQFTVGNETTSNEIRAEQWLRAKVRAKGEIA